MADEEPQLKGGHPPAVKAGGMRIVQHSKPGSSERPAKDAEDCTGLTQPVNINTQLVSGAPVKGHQDNSSVQIAHSPKPVNPVPMKPVNHIQQPRK